MTPTRLALEKCTRTKFGVMKSKNNGKWKNLKTTRAAIGPILNIET
jgi:hypothetical protein